MRISFHVLDIFLSYKKLIYILPVLMIFYSYDNSLNSDKKWYKVISILSTDILTLYNTILIIQSMPSNEKPFTFQFFSISKLTFSEILDILCDVFLKKNVSTIIYLSNNEVFGRSTASSQYFLQLASYLGIPVIA